jgi:hypothetical protein
MFLIEKVVTLQKPDLNNSFSVTGCFSGIYQNITASKHGLESDCIFKVNQELTATFHFLKHAVTNILSNIAIL